MKKKLQGDFQTPIGLAQAIVARLFADGLRPSRILEPTCGEGNFIRAILDARLLGVRQIVGIELEADYAERASQIRSEDADIVIIQGDIFAYDTLQDIAWSTEGPLLVIGNPPWVTNAMQGALGGHNLPPKSNIKGLVGLDALTGKANFDIAEYIWIKLIREWHHHDATIAMLCKTTTARNVLQYLYDQALPFADGRLYRIDARSWFRVATDACLCLISFGGISQPTMIPVFDSLEDAQPMTMMRFSKGRWVVNGYQYERVAWIDGHSPIPWRQGIKHDAADVMELRMTAQGWQNKLGEDVDIEPDYIFPLIKTADIQPRQRISVKRGVIVPQKSLGQDTRLLEHSAPKLWAYLKRHQSLFMARKSNIYQGKPPFSIFGIGDYSFAPYKVVVSGFYRNPYFIPVGTSGDKPILCDDTCYLLPCQTWEQAVGIAALLNHSLTQQFLASLLLENVKRPLTKSVLSRINFEAIAYRITSASYRSAIETLCAEQGLVVDIDKALWPSSADFLRQQRLPW